MIMCCPSCSTRNNLNPRQAEGSLAISCRSCGHRWKEVDTLDAIDVTDIPNRNLPRVINHDDAPEFEAGRLVELSRVAQEQFATEQAARASRMRNWAMFGLFLCAPLFAAALMPETVVQAAPISIRAYEALGYDINVYGLELRRVERQHVIVGGARVLAVKGDISNISDDTRKIPWLRFALVGPSGEELYTWNLDTGARPLRPGETTGFVTRVAAPPEAAQNLQIRFARSEEIGSNKLHDQP